MFRQGTKFALGLAVAVGAQLTADCASAQQATLDRIARTGTINVCADPDLLPYSSEKLNPAGYDMEIAQEIAKELGYKLGYDWYSTRRGTKIVRQLADGNCDFFLGFPVDASFEESNFKVILSKPYYTSGFAVVARNDAPNTILQDSKTKGVGVQMGMLPDFKLFERGYERKLFRNSSEIFDALTHKEIDVAVVPAPEGGWEIKTKGDPNIKVLTDTEKDFVYPMAIGFRKEDKALRDKVNAIIDKMQGDGRLTAIFDKYGMVKLAGTGGGVAPKSKADVEKEGGGKDDDGPPQKKTDAQDKKSEVIMRDFVNLGFTISDKPIQVAQADTAADTDEGKKVDADDPGADEHGLALDPKYRVDTTSVEDFPNDAQTIDKGRKLYKQACYKCHGPNGVSGGTIPDLRKFAANHDHYEMFAVIQAGRLDKGMPAWNDYLTPDEIKEIIVYVKALHKK
ncbi:MAG: transporter substrate-binding domain-containing protein [Hyphomicrobium sp.]